MTGPGAAGEAPFAQLTESECWARLRQAQVGRLAVLGADGPDICPINIVVDSATVVVRTAEGTKLAAALAGGPVALEADGLQRGESSARAWSVVARGPAQLIRRPDDLLGTLDLPLYPWHAGRKGIFVRIEPTSITGREFDVVDTTWWGLGLGRPAAAD